ncbi:MAG: CoA transferase, partial [Acidobacteriia bacterium]|nr:CoA transferase [Terriglobia bacterium]
MSDSTNILSGIRVIDCGTYIAAPAAAVVMSDFGAEVIKIERP